MKLQQVPYSIEVSPISVSHAVVDTPCSCSSGGRGHCSRTSTSGEKKGATEQGPQAIIAQQPHELGIIIGLALHSSSSASTGCGRWWRWLGRRTSLGAGHNSPSTTDARLLSPSLSPLCRP